MNKEKLKSILGKITKRLIILPRTVDITKFAGSWRGNMFSVTLNNGNVSRIRCKSKTYNKRLHALLKDF